MAKKITDKQKFEDAANGYGFEEIDQEGDGIYCDGCCRVHRRPTKMYNNRDGRGPRGGTTMCRYAVIQFYWQP